jgi:hypothetical protein
MQTSINLGPKQYAIIALTVITAVIHLVLAPGLESPQNILFILNGLGYLGLLGALYLPLDFLDGYRHIAGWALLAFTVITIIAYFAAWGVAGFSDVLGMIDKIVEVALAILLFTELRR